MRSIKLDYVKNNYSSIDKRYKVAGYKKEIAESIYLLACVGLIDRACISSLWDLIDKKIDFLNFHRSSCVGEVIRIIVEQNNVQCSAFTPKKRKKFRFQGILAHLC